MKKFLCAIGALSCFNVYSAVDFSGHAFVRHEQKDNRDFLKKTQDRVSASLSRFRLNISAKNDQATKWDVFLQPQFSKVFGAKDSGNVSSGNVYDTGLNVHQAYINYHPAEKLTIRAGREEFNFGDQLMVGGVGWHHVGRSFDGLSFNGNWIANGKDVLFASKLVDNNATTYSAGSKELYGFYHNQSLTKFIENFDLYYFYLTDSTALTTKTQIHTYGIRLKSKIDKLDYRVEANAQTGDTANVSTAAHQYDLEIGHALPFWKSRFSVEYFSATKNYNQLFPTGHKWLGIADMFSRRNVQGYAAHFSMMPTQDLKVKFDYHSFSRADSAVTAFNFSGGSYGTVGSKDDIATEFDVTLEYALDKALLLTYSYGHVAAGGYLKDQGAKDNMIFNYLQLIAKF